ncbi:hypothetical protein RMQ97_03555 [Maricaulis sp. D1M11]|uniref:hypothetical protein n=1 Tax=Maricaulis sp. D1M11 TaxID=3076117 RepID=UPI0039B6DAA3
MGEAIPLETATEIVRYDPDTLERYPTPAPVSKFTQCSDGRFFFGDNDRDESSGKIIEYRPGEDASANTVLHLPGVMVFDMVCTAEGTLLLATGNGTYVWTIGGETPTLLSRGADHVQNGFVTGVDQGRSGRTAFIDVSRNRWRQTRNRDNGYLDQLENRPWGTLYVQNRPNRRTRILNADLVLPSDIALSADERYAYVTEPNRATVKRVLLTGPHAGRSEIVTDAIPGQPVGIGFLPDGRLVVLLYEGRNPVQEQIYASPLLAHTLAKLRSVYRLYFHSDRSSLLVLDPETGAFDEWHALDTDAPVYLSSFIVDETGDIWINRGYPAELLRLPLSQRPAHSSE